MATRTATRNGRRPSIVPDTEPITPDAEAPEAPVQPMQLVLPPSLATALLDAGRRDATFVARLSGFIEGAGLPPDGNYALNLGALVLTKAP